MAAREDRARSDFAAFIQRGLGGRSEPPADAPAPAPPMPRLPAPNASQGASAIGNPPPATGPEVFYDLLANLNAPSGDGGWVQIK